MNALRSKIISARTPPAALCVLGLHVVFIDPDGSRYATVLESLPRRLRCGLWVARVRGRDGEYDCTRIMPVLHHGRLLRSASAPARWRLLARSLVSFRFRIGRLMVTPAGIFVWREHCAVRHPSLRWRQWDRVSLRLLRSLLR